MINTKDIDKNIKKLLVISFLVFLPFVYLANRTMAGYWDPVEWNWDDIQCVATSCDSSQGVKKVTQTCIDDGGEDCDAPASQEIFGPTCMVATITPCATTTPTPSPTVKPTDSPSQSSSNPSAVTCSNIAPNKSGANFHIYRKGGDAIAKWTPTAGNKANIYYKQANSPNWQYSVRDIENTGYYVIHYLGSLDITFALQQSNDCAGGPLTMPVIDGATEGWVLFR